MSKTAKAENPGAPGPVGDVDLLRKKLNSGAKSGLLSHQVHLPGF